MATALPITQQSNSRQIIALISSGTSPLSLSQILPDLSLLSTTSITFAPDMPTPVDTIPSKISNPDIEKAYYHVLTHKAEKYVRPEDEVEALETILQKANLDTIKKHVECFFERHGAQVMLDICKETAAFPLLSKRAHTSAIIDLDMTKIGPDLNDPKNKKIASKLQKEKISVQTSIKLKIYRFINNYLTKQNIRYIEQTRAEKIANFLDILLHDTKQLSEEGFFWIMLYVLEASKEKSEEKFTWIVSLGGDQEPSALVEGYLIEPLQKLLNLSEQPVSVLPRLLIVGTFCSQIVENCMDKLGREIDKVLHQHNSRVTLARTASFIQQYYPTIADRCTILEFPEYQKTGPARMLFTALWAQFSPVEREQMVKMFTLIRGEVVCPEEQNQLQTLFGEDSIPYVGRHIVSNGHMITDSHILRFGAESTEPQFWQVSHKMRDAVLQAKDELLANIQSKLADQPEICAEIEKQLQTWQELNRAKYLQGQMGMNVPALYYRRPDEPSLDEMIDDARSALNRQIEQANKVCRKRLEKIQQAYSTIIAHTGENSFQDFLATWKEMYLWPPETYPDGVKMMRSMEMKARVKALPGYMMDARKELNFWLD